MMNWHSIPRNCGYFCRCGMCFGPWKSPWCSKSPWRLAGNSCTNQEIGRDNKRPLTVATHYLDGVLLCNRCNWATSHAYDGYGTIIWGMLVLYIWHDLLIWNSQQLTAALRVLFLPPEWPQNIVLLKYMDIGAFVLTIDDGREYLQLTDQEGWMNTIRVGMTIVMSIIMSQDVRERTSTKYQCPFCDCWNKLKGNNGKSSIDWWVFCGSVQLRSSTDELSADPASDGFRSNQLNEIVTRWKLQALPTLNGIWYEIFNCGKEWVLLGAYNASTDRSGLF